MPVVLLIRHAQASFGAADYDVLSELGSEQVRCLHRSLRLRGISPNRIVTGSLRRQRDTALGLTPDGPAQAVIDDRWNEYDDDDVLTHHASTAARLERTEGDSRPELDSRQFQVLLDDALRSWADAGDTSSCRQTWPQFLERIRSALDELSAGLARGETALVFTSSGVISALAASLIGQPDRTFVVLNRISVNTAITKLLVGSRGHTLVTYNDHAHLEGPGSRLVTYR